MKKALIIETTKTTRNSAEVIEITITDPTEDIAITLIIPAKHYSMVEGLDNKAFELITIFLQIDAQLTATRITELSKEIREHLSKKEANQSSSLTEKILDNMLLRMISDIDNEEDSDEEDD